jgi:hypothetical protein
VKKHIGHRSIQVTVDIYSHVIPGANQSFVDRLDEVEPAIVETAPHNPQLPRNQAKCRFLDFSEVIEEFGGGAWTRTTDLRIMRPSL